jgi:hypothetical protein
MTDTFIEITNKDIYERIVKIEQIIENNCSKTDTINEKVDNNRRNISYLLYGLSAMALYLMGVAVL